MSETTGTTAAVQKQETKAVARPDTLRTLIEGDEFRRQIEKALPKHLTPDRFIRVAVTALTRTPKLRECTQVSLFKSLLTCSELGIEPDGRRAHLIPFNNRQAGAVECQLIVDYKGLVELAMRSGMVANIHADVVCENDAFVYDLGEVKQHSIDFRKPRGDVYAAYAICTFKDGTKKAEVLSRDEIEAVRKRSRAGQSGPWVTDWNEMAKKTAFRRLAKWLPLSPEYRDALDADADAIDITQQVTTPRPLARAQVGVAALTAPVDDPQPQDDFPPDNVPPNDDDSDPLPLDDVPAIDAATHAANLALCRVAQKDKPSTYKKCCRVVGLTELNAATPEKVAELVASLKAMEA